MNEIHKETLNLLNQDTVSAEDQKKLENIIKENHLNDVFWNAKDKVKDIVSQRPNKKNLMANIQKLIAEKGASMDQADKRGLMFVYFLADKGVMYAKDLGSDAGAVMDQKFVEFIKTSAKVETPKANPTPAVETKNTPKKSPDTLKDLKNIPADVNDFLDTVYAQFKSKNGTDLYPSIEEFLNSTEVQNLIAEWNVQDKLKNKDMQDVLYKLKEESIVLQKNILGKADNAENVIAEIETQLKNKLSLEEKKNLKTLFDAMSSENMDLATLKNLLNETGQKDLNNLLEDYAELKTQKTQLLNLLTGKVKSVIDGLQKTLLKSRNIQFTPNVVGASGLNVNLEKVLKLQELISTDPKKDTEEGLMHLKNKQYKIAAANFERAANAGYADAAFYLGQMMIDGKVNKNIDGRGTRDNADVEPNGRMGGTGYMKKAIELYQKDAKTDDSNRATIHEGLLANNSNYKEAFKTLKRRAEWDNANNKPEPYENTPNELQAVFNSAETTPSNTAKTETKSDANITGTGAEADDGKETLDSQSKSKEKAKGTGSVLLDSDYTTRHEDVEVGTYGAGMLNIYKNLPRQDREAYKRYLDVAKKNLRSVNIKGDGGISDIIHEIFTEAKYDALKQKVIAKTIDRSDLKSNFAAIYEKKGILNWGERGKIAKVLNEAKPEDLQVVAHIVESGMDLKNAANDKRAFEQGGFESKQVFDFLADYDTSGRVDTKSDVGSTFGLQLSSEIQRAIAKVGEAQVITKLLQRAQLTGDAATSAKIDTFLKANTKPDNAQLYEFLKENPATKLYLNSAIRMINGAANRVTPDLYNTLTGFDTGSEAMNDNESKLQDAFDHWIDTKLNDPAWVKNNEEFVLQVRKLGKYEMSSRFRRMINSVFDDMEIQTTNDGSGEMTDTKIEKQSELAEMKNKLMQKLTHNFLSGQVLRDPRSMQINAGFGRQWVSESMRDKIKRGVNPGVKLENGIPVAINIGAALKYDHQYNYKKVIGSSLDDVRSAKYVGLDMRANAQLGIDGKNTGAKIEASTGLELERQFLIGVKQMGRHLQEFNDAMLNAALSGDELPTTSTDLNTLLKAKITKLAEDSKYADFVSNNIDRLNFNADMLTKFIEQEGLLAKIEALPEKSGDGEGVTKKEALSQLLGTLQRGQVEMRKDDTLNALNGKVKLTGVGLGLIASLGLGRGGSNPNSPFEAGPGHGNGNTGGNNPIDDVVEGGPTPSPEAVSKRLKLLGFYVSAKLSTWETFYVPNAVKLKSVEQDLQTGKRFLEQSLEITDYAKNLDAVLNGTSDPEKKLFTITPDTATNTVKITINDKNNPDGKSLHELLHIYHKSTKEQKAADNTSAETSKDSSDLNFKYDGKGTLEIGDISDVAVLNVSDRKGDKTFLVLGAKGIGGGDSGGEALPKLEGAFNETKPLEGMKKNKEGKLDQAGILKVFDTLMNHAKATDTIKATLQKIKNAVTVDGKITLFNGSTQDLTKGGTLTINEKGEITFDAQLKGKLKLVYKDSTIESATKQNIDFVEYNKQFAQLEQDLAALDMQKLFQSTARSGPAYKEFMRICTFGDGKVDSNEYAQTKPHLKAMLNSYRKLDPNNKNTNELLGRIDSANDEEMSYIINRFKQLSSISTAHTENKINTADPTLVSKVNDVVNASDSGLSSASKAEIQKIMSNPSTFDSANWDMIFADNGGQNKGAEVYYMLRPLSVLVNQRFQDHGQWFQALIKTDRDVQAVSGSLQMMERYRKEVVSMLGNQRTWNALKEPNLVGMSAFYRGWGTPGLSMLQPGEANAVSGSKIDIRGGDIQIAKDLFLRKLDVNPQIGEILRQSLAQKLESVYPGIKLSDTNLKELIQNGKSNILHNGQQIELKMESKMVFYAMGECSNESLGLEMGTITLPGGGEINGEADIPPQPGSTLATRQASINDQVDAVEKNVSLRHNQFVNKPQKSGYGDDPNHGDKDQGGKDPIGPDRGDGTSGTGGNGGLDNDAP